MMQETVLTYDFAFSLNYTCNWTFIKVIIETKLILSPFDITFACPPYVKITVPSLRKKSSKGFNT